MKKVNWNLVIALVVIALFIFGISQADFSNHYSDIICK